MTAVGRADRRRASSLLAVAIVAALSLAGSLRAAYAASNPDAICATTSNPAACQQLIGTAISQGGSSPIGSGEGGSGSGAIQQLLQGFTQGQSSATVPGTSTGPQPSVVVTPEQPSSRHPLQRSHLEDVYSQRANSDLSQFGYDVLGNGGSVSALQIGAVQDQYILGQGDEIIVTLRGQENATYNIFVDRDGNVVLPRLHPISASGRRFGDFRQDLDAAIREGYIQTQDYITIGQVRQISVNVAGEVFSPGVYALSGLSTVLDALQLAGGVNKSGSLRDITVVRDGRALHIDLYRFLSPEGKTPDMTLRQGDRIVVAPIGATIAVAGEVRRPGIYELDPGVHVATVRWMIEMANGYTIRGAYRLTTLRTRADGKREAVDTSGHEGAPIRDGEILIVNNAVDYKIGNVALEGNVRLPGDYALNKVRTLHDLLPSAESFLPLTYTPFGFIVREDKSTLQRSVIAFSVAQLLAGSYNTDLQSDDIVHILTFDAMRQLLAISPAAQNPEGVAQSALANGLMGQSTVGQSPPGQSALMGAPATCIQPQQAVQDLPQPELAPSATALKLPNCPTVPPSGITNGGAAQLFAMGQSPAAGLNGAAQSMGTAALGQLASTGNFAMAPGSVAGTIATGGAAGGAVAGSTGFGADGSTANGFSASAGAAQGSGVAGLSADVAATIGFVVADYRVTVEGGVRQPGDYLAAPGATLKEIVDAAGGLVPEADLGAIEITSVAIDNIGGHSTATRRRYSLAPEKLASVMLRRLDVVQIPRVPSDQEDGNVMIDGEVQFPGTYHILKGERLSSVLTRAGGLTSQAYPQGAVFQRPSVARVQQSSYQRQADDLQKQLMAAVAQGGGVLSSSSGQALGLSPQAAGFVADVISQLRDKSADGRISIIADPVALAARPQADIELQPGDRLFIPKRPSEIIVAGEVLSPGSYRYSASLGASDYINLSGGYDRYADEGHVFVINPDGTSRLVTDDLFNFSPSALAPGSVVVVPRDLTPLDLGALTVTIAKVFSDFALSAASVAVLSHSNN